MGEKILKKTGQNQIKVITNWQHIEQPSPAFKRLMSLLLQKDSEAKKEDKDDSHKL